MLSACEIYKLITCCRGTTKNGDQDGLESDKCPPIIVLRLLYKNRHLLSLLESTRVHSLV